MSDVYQSVAHSKWPRPELEPPSRAVSMRPKVATT
jgi:hypothetical protein